MARPAVTTSSVTTQTEIINCKCKQKLTQNEQTNFNNKERIIYKLTSVQTESNETESNETEEMSNSSQQNDTNWTTMNRSRTHSLSPRSRVDSRGHGQRRKVGEPPEKQFRGSQSPNKSGNVTKSTANDRSLGAMAWAKQVTKDLEKK